LRAIIDSKRKPDQILEEIYLTVLLRLPTPHETKIVEQYGTGTAPKQDTNAGKPKKREDWVDITWALINSAEFLYRH
jgi:hypothetical protein